MFADDIVMCAENRELVEENMKRWRYEPERKGMKISHNKTESSVLRRQSEMEEMTRCRDL